MQTVGLTWEHALEVAAVVGAVGAALSVPRNSKIRNAGAFLREAAIIGVLYGVWQLAGKLSLHDSGGANARARWIRHAERFLPLPSEESVQHAVIHHSWLVQGANYYYASMHFTTLFIFLIWLFVFHRDRYRPIRQVLAWTTLGCLLVQLVPVAPPRMQPGIVDTAMKYGQSVYAGGFPADQLSAMPSVHVAWAVFVGWYGWHVTEHRVLRFIWPLHAVITIFVVVLTGNHWWSDGIVATLLLVAAAWLVHGVRTGWTAVRARHATGQPEPAPALETVTP